ncbi:hypothetical protein I317_06148 [Kwoniella heveanensis CBS 569]|nr:hypothetical protein I317_06148 [Kwoniella heveanensis CBS 569]
MPLANPTYTPIPHPKSPSASSDASSAHFTSFDAFYPFYLGEHSRPLTRRLHLVGTSIALTSFARVASSLIPLSAAFLSRQLSKVLGSPDLTSPGTVSALARAIKAIRSFALGTAFLRLSNQALVLTAPGVRPNIGPGAGAAAGTAGGGGGSEAIAALTWIAGGIVGAYGFAWISHFFVEKNKPATFTYPVWSLRGDLKMWWEVVTLQRAW